MYRTYRNLYRIRPSLSSIGQGRQRLRLPRGVSITFDVGILTLVLWLPCSLIFGTLVSWWIPQMPGWITGLFSSGYISYQIGKLDPAGKTVIAFLYDILKFMFRSKVHDGFEDLPTPSSKPERVAWKVKVALMEGTRIGSLPAIGRVSQLELRVPANVRVKRGEVIVQHRGERLPPGWYEIAGNQVKAKRMPPKISRTGGGY